MGTDHYHPPHEIRSGENLKVARCGLTKVGGATREEKEELLLLFVVPSVLAQRRAKLLEFQFFAPWLARNRIVVEACFFTNQIHNFRFFLTLGHL
jgi:hypothetical protein